MKTRLINWQDLIAIIAITIIFSACSGEKKLPIEMISIPAGTFLMGSPDTEQERKSDETQHTVTLGGFHISKYEITQAQWVDVMGSKERPKTNYGKGNNYPIYSISWYDVLVFCNKLSMKEGLFPAYSIKGTTDPAKWGVVPADRDAEWDAVELVSDSNGYRLPTEAQWEYACRGKMITAFNMGDEIGDNVGWYSGNSGSKAHRVGLKPVNIWGLYDMHGNVYEWCWDWYGDYPVEEQTDPLGASSGTERVYRGGGFGSSSNVLRSASRLKFDPNKRGHSNGFRLVRP